MHGHAAGHESTRRSTYMTHHMLPQLDLGWLDQVTNLFLIRRPEAVLASYHDRRINITLQDVGFKEQAEFFDRVVQTTGTTPVVIDSDNILADVWGAHWYKSVEASTGLIKRSAPRPLPDHLQSLAEECRPYYDRLAQYKI